MRMLPVWRRETSRVRELGQNRLSVAVRLPSEVTGYGANEKSIPVARCHRNSILVILSLFLEEPL